MNTVFLRLVNPFLYATPHLHPHRLVGTDLKQLRDRCNAALKDECEARGRSGFDATRWLSRQLDKFSGRDLATTLNYKPKSVAFWFRLAQHNGRS